MKTKSIITIASILMNALVAFTQSYTDLTSGHRYQVVGYMGLDEARAAATALGGHLVTIDSKAELDWYSSVFKRQTSYTWTDTVGHVWVDAGGIIRRQWINRTSGTVNTTAYQPWAWARGAASNYAIEDGNLIVLGKQQVIVRSTAWWCRQWQFQPGFITLGWALVEIE